MSDSINAVYIVVFAFLSCVVQTAAQIYPYNDTNCHYYNNNSEIKCDQLQEFPLLNIESNMTITSATFIGGNLTNIPNNSLPAGLRNIEFRYLPLINIEDGAFDACATDVQALFISGAHFKTLPHALAKLTNLSMLYIVDTPIKDWDESVLQHIAATVTSLYLTNDSLSVWPNWTSYFSALTLLKLSGNSFTFIPGDAFSFCKDTLDTLLMESAGLNHMPQALSALSNLTSLNVNGNNITNAHPSEPPIVLPRLVELHMKSNRLTSILDFSYMSNLAVIDLDNNIISDPHSGAFPPSLKSVSLNANNLTTVPTAITELTTYLSVYLSHNQIAKIDSHMFPLHVVNLDLSYNQLTTISDTVFRNLTSLYTLYLNDNPISTISDVAFESLLNIQYLHLSSTSLKRVPSAFVSFTQVFIFIYMDNITSLACPCPTPEELTSWFKHALALVVQGQCNNGQSISGYLMYSCVAENATAVPTTTHSRSPALESSLFCIYAFVHLLVLWFYCYY